MQLSTPLRVVLDAAGMQQETGRRGPPEFGGLDDHFRRNARDLRRVLRRVLLHGFQHGFETGGVLRDELAIDPAALDHDVQHAVEHADVAARAHRDEQVSVARNGRHARIENDQLARRFRAPAKGSRS